MQNAPPDGRRENIMAQASNLKRVVQPIPTPGITLNTTPTDYRPINGARRTDPQTYRNDALIFERALTRRSRRYRR